MKATRFCLSVVRRDASPAAPALAEDVDAVSDFLVSHVDELLKGAVNSTAPVTSFIDAAKQKRLDDLRTGTDDEFLRAAESLTRDLASQMARVNSKPGVLVCASFEEADGSRVAAAVKLQVVSDHGAVLEQLESGETVLSAVRKVLDRPGDLQKGLVYPDSRPGSETVIGDKANQSEARYFLQAMGVEAEEHSKRALGAVAKALADASAPGNRDAVVRRLDQAGPGPLEDVVAEAVRGISMERSTPEILRDLQDRERPIRAVDTSAQLKCTVRAGAIKIDLPAAEMSRVTIEPSLDGGFVIEVRTDAEPLVTYRS
jgi:hypothetical protein